MSYRADSFEKVEHQALLEMSDTEGRKYHRADKNCFFPQKEKIIILKVEARGLLKGRG